MSFGYANGKYKMKQNTLIINMAVPLVKQLSLWCVVCLIQFLISVGTAQSSIQCATDLEFDQFSFVNGERAQTCCLPQMIYAPG